MHYKKGILFLFINFSLTLILFSQNNTKPRQSWQSGISMLGGMLSSAEKTFSSLPYSGLYGGIAARVIFFSRNRNEHQLNFQYYQGKTTGKNSFSTYLKQRNINFSYTALFDVFEHSETSPFSFKVGADFFLGSIKNDYTGFINRSRSFLHNASLGVVGKVAFSFTDSPQSLILNNVISFRPYSYVVKPAFESESSTGEINESAKSDFTLQGGTLTGPAVFFNALNHLSVVKRIDDSQKISFAYSWNFWRLRGIREWKQANHQLELIYFKNF